MKLLPRTLINFFLVLSAYSAFHLSVFHFQNALVGTRTVAFQPMQHHQIQNDSTEQRIAVDPSCDYIWNASCPVPASCADTAVPSMHDPTVKLSPCIHRPWLDESSSSTEQAVNKPKVKILLTSFGWNHPDPQRRIASPRSKRQRELLQAIVDHPLFDPYGWDDYMSGRKVVDPSVRYYVFLDIETCHEINYPHYGKPDLNHDTDGGRVKDPKEWDELECYYIDHCPYVNQVLLASPVFTQSSVHSTLVYFECTGSGPWADFRKQQQSRQISIVSMSAHESQILSSIDQGLPPPSVSDIAPLTRQKLEQIETCNEGNRPYLLTFVGAIRRGSPRQKLVDLHNETMGILAMRKGDLQQQQQEQQQQNLTYVGLLKQSKFAAAPRGTNLFSYRFTEILAAGAIPVVHSDGWVLPFRRELVDWKQCAVVIPEDRIDDTARILLQDIAPEQRCQMRRRCLEIYQNYMATPQGTLTGILQSLELLATASTA